MRLVVGLLFQVPPIVDNMGHVRSHCGGPIQRVEPIWRTLELLRVGLSPRGDLVHRLLRWGLDRSIRGAVQLEIKRAPEVPEVGGRPDPATPETLDFAGLKIGVQDGLVDPFHHLLRTVPRVAE
jgi:hypothetical protein